MKKLTQQFLLLALSVFAISCAEDDPGHSSRVQFNLNLIGSDNESINALPHGNTLIISVAHRDGEPAITDQQIDFTYDGSGLVSVPLELPAGNYSLTDLKIVDENLEEIAFTTPRAGATLANAVGRPLDLSFTVSPAKMATLGVDLLSVKKRSPGDFGLASFKVSKNNLKITVRAADSDGPVTAEALIMQNGVTIDQYQLEAKMNQLPIRGDASQPYTLMVKKEGYADHTQQFTISDLKGKPLQVTLQPEQTEPTFYIHAHADLTSGENEFQIDLIAPMGSAIDVDWGDGTRSSYVSDGERINLYHKYAAEGDYHVNITGDIDQITYFYSFYGQGQMDSINFEHLTALTEVRLGLTRSPSVLDLTHNTNLTHLSLAGGDNLEHLVLPKEHNITLIDISGDNLMTTAAVDAVINDIYENSVAKNITGGSFALFKQWYQEEGDETLLGPPSAAGLAQLKTLRDDYGWRISPDPFD
jgi:hypothetical protein